jgi:hypothetical protein
MLVNGAFAEHNNLPRRPGIVQGERRFWLALDRLGLSCLFSSNTRAP